MKIFDFKILNFGDDFLEFTAEVSKGTYIRTLGEQIADFCGTIAYTKVLRRLSIGEIDISRTTPLHLLTESNWSEYLQKLKIFLPKFEEIKISNDEKLFIKNGREIKNNFLKSGKVLLIDESKNEIALGFAEKESIKPTAVFV